MHLSAIKLTKAENEMEIVKLIGANIAKYIEGKWSFKICSAFQKEQKFISLLESSPYVIFIEDKLREIHPKEFRGIREKIDNFTINNLELEVSSLETLSKIVKIHSLGEIFSLLDRIKDVHDALLFQEFSSLDKPYRQYEEYEKRMYRDAGIQRMRELCENRVQTA